MRSEVMQDWQYPDSSFDLYTEVGEHAVMRSSGCHSHASNQARRAGKRSAVRRATVAAGHTPGAGSPLYRRERTIATQEPRRADRVRSVSCAAALGPLGFGQVGNKGSVCETHSGRQMTRLVVHVSWPRVLHAVGPLFRRRNAAAPAAFPSKADIVLPRGCDLVQSLPWTRVDATQVLFAQSALANLGSLQIAECVSARI